MPVVTFDDTPAPTKSGAVTFGDEAPAAAEQPSWWTGKFGMFGSPLKDVGGILEGIGGGAAGTPGDVESLARTGAAYAPSVGAIAGYGEAGLPVPDEVLAGLKDVKVSKNLLPTSGDIERKLPGSGDTEVEAGRRLGELVSPLAIGKALKVGEGAVNLAGRTVRSALGAEMKASAGALRGGVRSQLAGAAGSEAAGAGASEVGLLRRAESARKLAAVERARRGIALQDAAQAAQAGGTPAAAPDNFYAEIAENERKARVSGFTIEQAQDFAVEQAQKVVDAEAAANKIDKEFAARPQMSSNELAGMVQETAGEMETRLTNERTEKSGLGRVIAEAGVEPTTPTQHIIDYVEDAKKYLASGTRAVLDHFLGDLSTTVTEGEKTTKLGAIPLARVESVRKELRSAIDTKSLSIDKAEIPKSTMIEALHYLTKVEHMLVESATKVHPNYGPALNTFRELSRPLDLFDRGGALGDVTATHLRSDEFKLLRGDVVGRVLKRANAGSPVLARLVAENPELREAAKLYFNRELFATTKAPSAEDLTKFLAQNENALRDLGLYDEFSTVEGAKKAIEGTIRVAQAEAKDASAVAEEVRSLHKSVSGVKAAAEEKIRDFEARIIELDSLPADKVASKATTLAESLREGNYISNDQYKELIDHIRVVQKQQGDTARARTTIKALLIASALAGGGFYLERFVRPLVPF